MLYNHMKLLTVYSFLKLENLVSVDLVVQALLLEPLQWNLDITKDQAKYVGYNKVLLY